MLNTFYLKNLKGDFMELLQKEVRAEDTSSRCVFNNNGTRIK